MGRTINYLITVLLAGFLLTCEFRETPQPRNDQYFLKYYGGPGDQFGKDLLQTSDGGFLILATTDSSTVPTDNDKDILIIKTDELGSEQWRQKLGTPEMHDEAISITKIPTGGYAYTSTLYSQEGIKNTKVTIISETGEELNSRVFGQSFNFEPKLISSYPDGLIVSGTTDSIKSGSTEPSDVSDMFSFKMDFNLQPDTAWTVTYGFEAEDRGGAVIHQQQNIFLFVMSTGRKPPFSTEEKSQLNFNIFSSRNGTPDSDFAIRYLGTNNSQIATSIDETEAGNVYIAGNSVNTSSNKSGLYFVSINRSNEIQKGPTEVFRDFSVQVSDIKVWGEQGITVLGETLTPDQETEDIYLARFANDGSLVWEHFFGFTENNDIGGSLVELPDGSIAFTGSIHLENQHKICLIKTKSDGSMKP